MGWSKIFRTDAVKIVKLTIRPIGRHQPRSSSLLHIDTSPTFSSISGMLPGSPLLSECQALCDSAWIYSMVSNQRPLSFNFSFGNRKKSQGAKTGEYGGWGITTILFFARNWWVRMKCETGRCHSEAARTVLAKVGGDVLARSQAVAAKLRSRARNSQFGLLGQILCTQSP